MTINTDQIRKIVEEKFIGTDCFLVEVKTGGAKIRITADKPAGITIAECSELSRYLREKINDETLWEHFELEISSPGMEDPLKVLPQYKKRIGREISILTIGGTVRKGILKSAEEDCVALEETIIQREGNKKTRKIIFSEIPFGEIKETKVVFNFNKIRQHSH
jgi:ribosome maturation factor RimP